MGRKKWQRLNAQKVEGKMRLARLRIPWEEWVERNLESGMKMEYNSKLENSERKLRGKKDDHNHGQPHS